MCTFCVWSKRLHASKLHLTPDASHRRKNKDLQSYGKKSIHFENNPAWLKKEGSSTSEFLPHVFLLKKRSCFVFHYNSSSCSPHSSPPHHPSTHPPRLLAIQTQARWQWWWVTAWGLGKPVGWRWPGWQSPSGSWCPAASSCLWAASQRRTSAGGRRQCRPGPEAASWAARWCRPCWRWGAGPCPWTVVPEVNRTLLVSTKKKWLIMAPFSTFVICGWNLKFRFYLKLNVWEKEQDQVRATCFQTLLSVKQNGNWTWEGIIL